MTSMPEDTKRIDCAECTDESDPIDRETKMRGRIANFFKSQGISTFSANVLVEFLKVTHVCVHLSDFDLTIHIQKVSDTDSDQTARLRAWLLHGVNHRLNSAYLVPKAGGLSSCFSQSANHRMQPSPKHCSCATVSN